MKIPMYQIDAFTSRVFGGNPAAVCPLESWLDDAAMQAIAEENNLAETAFFVKEPTGYHIRWFTPAAEIDLCGHATLAAAYVLLTHVEPALDSVTFASQSGPLTVSRDGHFLAMDFPAWVPQPVTVPPALLDALGGPAPLEVLGTRDYLVLYPSQKDILALAPSYDKLQQVDRLGVIVTAPGEDADFVSRFFAPNVGVPEDPVTGSAHSTLIPYWSGKLGKTKMFARQLSRRGGELHCEARGDRVGISGQAVPYLHGEIEI